MGIKFGFNEIYGLKYDRGNMNVYDYITLLYFVDPEKYKALMSVTMDQVEYLYLSFENTNLKKPSLQPISQESDLDVTKDNYEKYLLDRSILALDINDTKNGSLEYKLLGFTDGFSSLIKKSIFEKISLYELRKTIEGETITKKLIAKLVNKLEKKYPKPTKQQKWFIELLKDPDNYPLEEKHQVKEEEWLKFIKKLLEFMTGRAILDLEQNYVIGMAPNMGKNELPKSHTCFNTIDLPEYESKDIMYKKLKQAVFFAEEGTGFEGGKMRRRRRIKQKIRRRKKIRKHRGINQTTGKLKKGYKYSGKRLRNGLPEILKIRLKF